MGSSTRNEMRSPTQSAANAWPAFYSSLVLLAHALLLQAAGTCITAAACTAFPWWQQPMLCSYQQHMCHQLLLIRAEGDQWAHIWDGSKHCWVRDACRGKVGDCEEGQTEVLCHSGLRQSVWQNRGGRRVFEGLFAFHLCLASSSAIQFLYVLDGNIPLDPPTGWGGLIFNGRFRIRLNEKLLFVSLSGASEGSAVTLNVESHDIMLERLQGIASNAAEVWDGKVEFSGCLLHYTMLVLFSMAVHANLPSLPGSVWYLFASTLSVVFIFLNFTVVS